MMAEEKRTRRILIVDDDPIIVQMLSDILVAEGYELATATQSLRAFDRAKETQPDLILMDIMMPYLDGLDQIKLLSLDEELCLVPFIVITAKARALDGIENLTSLRILEYLYKPFEISELLKKIAHVLSGEVWPPEVVTAADYLPKGNPYHLREAVQNEQVTRESIHVVFSDAYRKRYPAYASALAYLAAPTQRRTELTEEPAIRVSDGQPDPDVKVLIRRLEPQHLVNAVVTELT